MTHPKQKYPTGTRVQISDDLGSSMRHFPKGKKATVLLTYAQQFGGISFDQYALDIDGIGYCAWYNEDQLTSITDEMQLTE